jgi:hypothetical protein
MSCHSQTPEGLWRWQGKNGVLHLEKLGPEWNENAFSEAVLHPGDSEGRARKAEYHSRLREEQCMKADIPSMRIARKKARLATANRAVSTVNVRQIGGKTLQLTADRFASAYARTTSRDIGGQKVLKSTPPQ